MEYTTITQLLISKMTQMRLLTPQEIGLVAEFFKQSELIKNIFMHHHMVFQSQDFKLIWRYSLIHIRQSKTILSGLDGLLENQHDIFQRQSHLELLSFFKGLDVERSYDSKQLLLSVINEINFDDQKLIEKFKSIGERTDYHRQIAISEEKLSSQEWRLDFQDYIETVLEDLGTKDDKSYIVAIFAYADKIEDTQKRLYRAALIKAVQYAYASYRLHENSALLILELQEWLFDFLIDFVPLPKTPQLSEICANTLVTPYVYWDIAQSCFLPSQSFYEAYLSVSGRSYQRKTTTYYYLDRQRMSDLSIYSICFERFCSQERAAGHQDSDHILRKRFDEMIEVMSKGMAAISKKNILIFGESAFYQKHHDSYEFENSVIDSTEIVQRLRYFFIDNDHRDLILGLSHQVYKNNHPLLDTMSRLADRGLLPTALNQHDIRLDINVIRACYQSYCLQMNTVLSIKERLPFHCAAYDEKPLRYQYKCYFSDVFAEKVLLSGRIHQASIAEKLSIRDCIISKKQAPNILAILKISTQDHLFRLNEKEAFDILIWATKSGEESIIAALPGINKFVNKRDKNGDTALLIACRQGALSILQTLVQCGADINQTTSSGQSAIIEAILHSHIEIVDYLISQGAHIDTEDKNQITPLIHACCHGLPPIVAILLHNNADSNRQSFDGKTALIFAAMFDYVEIIELLLKNHASINHVDAYGRTAFMYACLYGSERAAQKLLESGSNLYAQDCHDQDALALSIRIGHETIVSLIVNQQIAIDRHLGDNEECYLGLAAIAGDIDILKIIIAAGAKIDNTNKQGQSPLMLALQKNRSKCALALLYSGANPLTRCNSGQNALDYSSVYSDKKTYHLIHKIATEGDMAKQLAINTTPLEQQPELNEESRTDLNIEHLAAQECLRKNYSLLRLSSRSAFDLVKKDKQIRK